MTETRRKMIEKGPKINYWRIDKLSIKQNIMRKKEKL